MVAGAGGDAKAGHWREGASGQPSLLHKLLSRSRCKTQVARKVSIFWRLSHSSIRPSPIVRESGVWKRRYG